MKRYERLVKKKSCNFPASSVPLYYLLTENDRERKRERQRESERKGEKEREIEKERVKERKEKRKKWEGQKCVTEESGTN